LAAAKNRLSSRLNPHEPPGANPLVESLRAAGYQVILSLGQEEENRIGSNCGQYLRAFLGGGHKIEGGYTYPLYIGSDLANGLNSQ